MSASPFLADPRDAWGNYYITFAPTAYLRGLQLQQALAMAIKPARDLLNNVFVDRVDEVAALPTNDVESMAWFVKYGLSSPRSLMQAEVFRGPRNHGLRSADDDLVNIVAFPLATFGVARAAGSSFWSAVGRTGISTAGALTFDAAFTALSKSGDFGGDPQKLSVIAALVARRPVKLAPMQIKSLSKSLRMGASSAKHFPNGASDDFAKLAGQIRPQAGYFDLYIHSDNRGTVLAQLGRDGSKEVADLASIEKALKAAGWNGKDPIRLISCSVGDPALGRRAAAAQLAEYLNVMILAPTADIILFEGGAYVITNAAVVTPTTASTGVWALFLPRIAP